MAGYGVKPNTERVFFQDNLFLHEDDFIREQQYHMTSRRWANIHLHGKGIVGASSALSISVDAGDYVISEGVAIDGLGRELVVPSLPVFRVSIASVGTLITGDVLGLQYQETARAEADGVERQEQVPLNEIIKGECRLIKITGSVPDDVVVLGTYDGEGISNLGRVYVTSTTDIKEELYTDFVKTDGSRPFIKPVAGVDPVNSTDLATKSYVDQNSGVDFFSSDSNGFRNPEQISFDFTAGVLTLKVLPNADGVTEDQEFFAKGSKYVLSKDSTPACSSFPDGTSFVFLLEDGTLSAPQTAWDPNHPSIAIVIYDASTGTYPQILDDIHGINMSMQSREKNNVEGAWIAMGHGNSHLGFEETGTPGANIVKSMAAGRLVNDDKPFDISAFDSTSKMTVLYGRESSKVAAKLPVNWDTVKTTILSSRQNSSPTGSGDGIQSLTSGHTSAMIRIVRSDDGRNDANAEAYKHAVVLTDMSVPASCDEASKLFNAQQAIKRVVDQWYKYLITDWKIVSVYLYSNGAVENVYDMRAFTLNDILCADWYKKFAPNYQRFGLLMNGELATNSNSAQIIVTDDATLDANLISAKATGIATGEQLKLVIKKNTVSIGTITVNELNSSTVIVTDSVLTEGDLLWVQYDETSSALSAANATVSIKAKISEPVEV